MTEQSKFYIELVWNREFHWSRHFREFTDLDAAIAASKTLEHMGDGSSVKRTRIVTQEGVAVYRYGKKVGEG